MIITCLILCSNCWPLSLSVDLIFLQSFEILMFVYKCVNNLAPECITELITVRNAESSLLVYKNYDTTFGRASFTYIAPKLWNNLPDHIRLSHSLLNFKKQAKFLLFNNYDSFIKSVFKYH